MYANFAPHILAHSRASWLLVACETTRIGRPIQCGIKSRAAFHRQLDRQIEGKKVWAAIRQTHAIQLPLLQLGRTRSSRADAQEVKVREAFFLQLLLAAPLSWPGQAHLR